MENKELIKKMIEIKRDIKNYLESVKEYMISIDELIGEYKEEEQNKKQKTIYATILQDPEGTWEGIYIDGVLIEQGNLNLYKDPNKYLKMAKKYKFDLVRIKVLDNEDYETLKYTGSLYEKLEDYGGKYND